MRSNHEYDYFGNVLEYEYDYFPSYSSTSTSTQKVLVLEYEYKYTSTITPSLLPVVHDCMSDTCQETLDHYEILQGLMRLQMVGDYRQTTLGECLLSSTVSCHQQ